MNELSDYDLLLAVRKLPHILIEMMKKYPGRIFVAGGLPAQRHHRRLDQRH
jgi:hypothetical protein